VSYDSDELSEEEMKELKGFAAFMLVVVLGTLFCALVAGCSTRVLVRDCQDVKETELKNCELVKKL